MSTKLFPFYVKINPSITWRSQLCGYQGNSLSMFDLPLAADFMKANQPQVTGTLKQPATLWRRGNALGIALSQLPAAVGSKGTARAAPAPPHPPKDRGMACPGCPRASLGGVGCPGLCRSCSSGSSLPHCHAGVDLVGK